MQHLTGPAGSATSPDSSAAGAPSGVGAGIAGFSLSLPLRHVVVSCSLVARSWCRCSSGARLRAVGAPAPVDDLGLVDLVARVVWGGEARERRPRRSRRRPSARRSGRRGGGGCRRPGPRSASATGGLDAAEEAAVGEGGERVVHRLPGRGAELGPDQTVDLVRGAVRSDRQCPEHGQALRSHVQTVPAQEVDLRGEVVGRHGRQPSDASWTGSSPGLAPRRLDVMPVPGRRPRHVRQD